MISVLCVGDHRSNYRLIPGLDLWDAERDAYNFAGTNPVITHPPCQQWSQMRGFAHDNPREKELAWFCLEKVQRNGGILEHPRGSSFFHAAGIRPTLSVNQSWFGFAGRKTTYLYFVGFKPQAFPITFDCPTKLVERMSSKERSRQPLAFCEWLIKCVTACLLVVVLGCSPSPDRYWIVTYQTTKSSHSENHASPKPDPLRAPQ